MTTTKSRQKLDQEARKNKISVRGILTSDLENKSFILNLKTSGVPEEEKLELSISILGKIAREYQQKIEDNHLVEKFNLVSRYTILEDKEYIRIMHKMDNDEILDSDERIYFLHKSFINSHIVLFQNDILTSKIEEEFTAIMYKK